MTLTEEQQEADAEQDQDVRHVRDVVVSEDLHLLFGRTHEEKTTCVEQEWWEVLEAVDLLVVLSVRSNVEGSLVAQNEADLDDPGETCGHERVAEDGVDVRAEL